jgi:hypothetical protein
VNKTKAATALMRGHAALPEDFVRFRRRLFPHPVISSQRWPIVVAEYKTHFRLCKPL